MSLATFTLPARAASLAAARSASLRGSQLRAAAAAPRRVKSACAPRTAAGLVQKLNAEELELAIAERDKPLVIDFFASWCGPCVLLATELEKVAAEMGDQVRIVKVDTDAEPDLSSQLQIQGLPTMVFVPLARDKAALRTEGLLPAETIKKIINEEMLGMPKSA